MKISGWLLSIFTVAFFGTTVLAGEAQFYGSDGATTTRTTSEAKLDLFRLDSSYVFESKLDNDFGPDDEQDALQTGIEYSHRFHLGSGKIYLRLGAAYDRFDFGNSNAPVPNHLQSMAGVVGLEYLVGNDVGAFLYLRPGFYTENDIGSSSFDMPITIGRVFVLQQDRLFLVVGANAAGLRGEFPVLPIAGLIWKPSEQWNLFLVPPEPRITYSPSKNLDFYAGGQLVGGSFRTDRQSNIFPAKLSNAQVDYSEYRAGVGVDFHCANAVSLNVGGGYAFQRRFNFERAGEEFKSDPAPYVRVALRAEF